MIITCEKKYALRAVFELAKHHGRGPVKGADIARSQEIPTKFLEVILSKLKRIGLVKSKRGFHGGYTLGRSASDITVGSVLEPLAAVSCLTGSGACSEKEGCPFSTGCVFLPMWDKVRDSINEVYYRTTIQDLLDDDHITPVKIN